LSIKIFAGRVHSALSRVEFELQRRTLSLKSGQDIRINIGNINDTLSFSDRGALLHKPLADNSIHRRR
jgi:hypothetical protein